jgi:hypothetical protein
MPWIALQTELEEEKEGLVQLHSQHVAPEISTSASVGLKGFNADLKSVVKISVLRVWQICKFWSIYNCLELLALDFLQ